MMIFPRQLIFSHAGDLGKDYEHCLELQKKLDDVNSDMRVDEERYVDFFSVY